jgi:hypothetical protein
MKMCTKCKRSLVEKQFHRNKRMKDGLHIWCKQCVKKYKQHYQDTVCQTQEWKEKRNERKKSWKSASKEAVNERSAKACQNNQDKYQARRVVLYAIRHGELKKGPCEYADETCDGKVHAHHLDYSRPLEVQWLCVKHHGEVHRKINRCQDS